MQRRERIFRNGMGLRFRYPIHEFLNLIPGMRIRAQQDIVIVHNKVAPAPIEPLSNPALCGGD